MTIEDCLALCVLISIGALLCWQLFSSWLYQLKQERDDLAKKLGVAKDKLAKGIICNHCKKLTITSEMLKRINDKVDVMFPESKRYYFICQQVKAAVTPGNNMEYEVDDSMTPQWNAGAHYIKRVIYNIVTKDDQEPS